MNNVIHELEQATPTKKTTILRYGYVEELCRNQGLIYTPLGGYTPPCDMSTHPLGRTPRGHKVVSTSA